jgi:hypothetical protein
MRERLNRVGKFCLATGHLTTICDWPMGGRLDGVRNFCLATGHQRSFLISCCSVVALIS